MKIYTKTGDKGKTSLFDGTITSKNDVSIDALGALDELNAHLGLIITLIENQAIQAQLQEIQNNIFVVSGYVATPTRVSKYLPSMDVAIIEILEKQIDVWTNELPPLTHFILPGGSTAVAHIHIARTICRRAERSVILMNEPFDLNVMIPYLNRLSDYLFTLARWVGYINRTPEIVWNP